ncbi:MAG: hypothetical protein ACP5OG_05400 [Candidatus Nanoarchaeia archaeon]
MTTKSLAKKYCSAILLFSLVFLSIELISAVNQGNKPHVELFIMYYCPYALQMQQAIIPALDILGEDKNG